MNDDRDIDRLYDRKCHYSAGAALLEEMKRRRPLLSSAGCYLIASLATAPTQALVTPGRTRHLHRHLPTLPTIGHQDAVSTSSRFNGGGGVPKRFVDGFRYKGDERSTRLTTTRTGDEESKVRRRESGSLTYPATACLNLNSQRTTTGQTVPSVPAMHQECRRQVQIAAIGISAHTLRGSLRGLVH